MASLIMTGYRFPISETLCQSSAIASPFILDDEGAAVYRVLDRYLVDLRSSCDADNDAQFWVLVVDQFEEDHSSEFDQLVRAIYRENFARIWQGNGILLAPVETAEKLDRSNRDPAYWTFERKEILRKEREARLAAIKAEET